MPHLDAQDDRVRVGLSSWEQIAALHRPFTVNRNSIVTCEVIDDPLSTLHGVRAPGTSIPGLLAYGTFRYRGGKDFVAVRRGRPAIRLLLRGERYARIMLSMAQPERLTEHLALPDEQALKEILE